MLSMSVIDGSIPNDCNMDNHTIVGTSDHDSYFGGYEMKEEKRMYILQYSDFLEEWTLTTKENHERRIQNAREIHHFSKRDGFQCTTDVLQYITKHFGIHLDRIACVGCY